nr:unnamed protein product [Digitaria exilis]
MAGNLPVCSHDDRITDLPEDIFEHVLSFLPAEDAVRSSVLSKRWRGAWTHAPVLNLSDEQHQQGRWSFLPFARAVLGRYGSPDIPSLNVAIGCAYNLGPSTAAWLGDAMERVVGSVCVSVTAPGGLLGQLVLPRRLRAKSISLTLSGATCSYNTPLVFPSEPGAAAPAASYGNLEELSLSRVRLQERDMRSLGAFLSSCCPRLRKLRLRKVSVEGRLPLWPLVLRMEQLEELETEEVDTTVVEISAPRLETLIWHGGFTKRISFLAGSQRSIRRLARLCFYLPAEESRSITAVRLLEARSEASDISVRIDVPDHCSPSWLSREHLEHVPLLPNVRILSLQVAAVLRFITCPIAPVILSFIRRCPNLRWLHIDLTMTHWFSKSRPNYLTVPIMDDDEARDEEALPLQPSDFDRLKAQRDKMHLASLREIRLSGFMGTSQEMEVADLLFGPGTARPSLERVSISLFPQLIRQDRASLNPLTARFPEISLSAHPKPETSCERSPILPHLLPSSGSTSAARPLPRAPILTKILAKTSAPETAGSDSQRRRPKPFHATINVARRRQRIDAFDARHRSPSTPSPVVPSSRTPPSPIIGVLPRWTCARNFLDDAGSYGTT